MNLHKWKKHIFSIILLVESIIMLFMLGNCFQQDVPTYEISGNMVADAIVDNVFTSENFFLEPGVYQVQIKTSAQMEQSIFVELKSDQSYFKSLRTNGVNIMAGQQEEDFEAYVSARVPSAYIYCEFNQGKPDTEFQITVVRTCSGNRMLFIITLTVFLCIDLLVWLRKQILAGKISQKKQIVFWGLTTGILIAYFPYFTDYFSFGADTAFHLRRIAYLADTLREGNHIPVRIQSTWMYGHGYATSLFYGELFFYIPALLRLCGFSILFSYKAFVLFATIITAILTYIAFYSCIKEELAALTGSLFYLLIPFRLFSVYSEGAVGKYFAMAFLPLICCGMYLLITQDILSKDYKKYKWYLIWGISGVLQCHLLTTEIVVFSLVIACILLWKYVFRRQTFFQLIEAAGLALALNAWFWIPMVYMLMADSYLVTTLPQSEIQSRGVELAGYFQMLPKKGGGGTGGIQMCEPVQLGAGFGIFLGLIFVKSCLKRVKNQVGNLFAILAMVGLIISTKYFPWDMLMKIPVVGKAIGALQFPARWMLLACLFAAMSITVWFWTIWKAGGWGRIIFIASIIIMFASALYQVNDIAHESGAVYLYDIENMGTVGVMNGEYLIADTDAFSAFYHTPIAEEGLCWTEYQKNGTTVDVFVSNGTTEEKKLDIPLYGYKGYDVSANGYIGEVAPYISEDRGNHGDLRIIIPENFEGKLHIYYRGEKLFILANCLSLVTIGAILLKYCYRKMYIKGDCIIGRRREYGEE